MEPSELKIDAYYVCITPGIGKVEGAGWKNGRIVKNQGPDPKKGTSPGLVWPYKPLDNAYCGIYSCAVREATIDEIIAYETGTEVVILINNYEIF